MKTLGAIVLAGWVLLAPDPHGIFKSAGACAAEVAAWQARAMEGLRWVAGQCQQVLQQKDQAVTMFWQEAVYRAAGQMEQALAARCAEVKS